MFRRDFFKMLGAAVASAVCAPLVKLLPAKKETLQFSQDAFAAFEPRLRIGDTIRIKKPARYVIKQADDDLKAVTGIYEPALDADREMRQAALRDPKFSIGTYKKWPS